MTETPQPEPISQAVAPRVWTRLAGAPDVEVYHEGIGAILVTSRRVPGVTMVNSNGQLPDGEAGITIPWEHS